MSSWEDSLPQLSRIMAILDGPGEKIRSLPKRKLGLLACGIISVLLLLHAALEYGFTSRDTVPLLEWVWCLYHGASHWHRSNQTTGFVSRWWQHVETWLVDIAKRLWYVSIHIFTDISSRHLPVLFPITTKMSIWWEKVLRAFCNDYLPANPTELSYIQKETATRPVYESY